MGARPATPLIFLKPATSLITEGSPIKIPPGCAELHHEAELGVIIGRKGADISMSEAMGYVGGYTICLDMTARDMQMKAKQAGHPWDLSKGFDTSCPVGHFIPKENEQVQNVDNLRVWCRVNGQLRQDGNTSELLFKIPELVSYISSYFTLEPGDLILTGTPSGVGPVKAGDVIEAGLGDVTAIKFDVVAKGDEQVNAKKKATSQN